MVAALVIEMIDAKKAGAQQNILRTLVNATYFIVGIVLVLALMGYVITYKSGNIGAGFTRFIELFWVSLQLLIDGTSQVAECICNLIGTVLYLCIIIFNYGFARRAINALRKNLDIGVSAIVFGALNVVFAIASYFLVISGTSKSSDYYHMGTASILYIVLGSVLMVLGIVQKIVKATRKDSGNVNPYGQQMNGYNWQNSFQQQYGMGQQVNGYNPQNGYPPHNNYGQQMAYPQQNGYNQQMAYPQQNGYNQQMNGYQQTYNIGLQENGSNGQTNMNVQQPNQFNQ